jgi:hypothetical protein
MTRNDIRAFYALPAVRQRIEEYLGRRADRDASCVYLAQPDLGWPRMDTVAAPDRLPALLDTGLDLSRSLWDRESLIAHLDIEYVNFDFAKEPYLDQDRTFRLQEPVCRAIETMLEQHGISPLHLATGRGHHYVWRVRFRSRTFERLRQLGRCNDTLLARYQQPGMPIAASVTPAMGNAFAGLGLLMEYLAGRIKAEAAVASALPVELTAVVVGPGERGREMVSLDISEYGDPFYLRVIRTPFTAYLKSSALPETQDSENSDDAMLVTVVQNGSPLEKAVVAMRDAETAAALAGETATLIPDCTTGCGRLISSYERSPLCSFHNDFYSQSQHPPEIWPLTYDRLNLSDLPPCAADILLFPNPRLMQPAGIELVVRVLLALRWHPRHIAGLLRSRYERDYNWGDHWLIHDAATRADFYTRIFAGLFGTGLDDLVDFNAQSIAEKGLHVQPEDGCRIAALRETLLERRHHG